MDSEDPAVGPLVELTFWIVWLIPAVGLIPLTITNAPDDRCLLASRKSSERIITTEQQQKKSNLELETQIIQNLDFLKTPKTVRSIEESRIGSGNQMAYASRIIIHSNKVPSRFLIVSSFWFIPLLLFLLPSVDLYCISKPLKSLYLYSRVIVCLFK